MSYLTKYGSFWGFLPQTAGRMFFVAPSASYTIEGRTYSASDNNDGLSPERAFLTLGYAVDSTRSGAMASGDIAVMLNGDHSYAATVTVATAGLVITGIPGNAPRERARRNGGGKKLRTTITNTATAGVILTVTASDVEISHLHFLPTAAGGQCVAPSTGVSRLYVHDCTFGMNATASTTTYGISRPNLTTGIVDDVLISNCYFESGTATTSGANGPAVNMLGTCHGWTIEQSTFELKGTAAWANAILSSNASSTGLMIRDCDFKNPTSATTVITTAINTTSQTIDGSTQVFRCYIPTGTDGVTASAMADIVLAGTYLADTSGGALVTNA